MVRIRMSRIGRPHLPFYRISAVDSRVKRDGKVIENLGWYNPVAGKGEKEMELKIDRIKHWLSKGAQPSDTMRDFLAKNNLVDVASWKKDREARVAAVKKAAEKKAAAEAAGKKDGEKKEEAKA